MNTSCGACRRAPWISHRAGYEHCFRTHRRRSHRRVDRHTAYSAVVHRPGLVAAAQRLRYDVFTSEPGFALPAASDGRDADRFDEHCDHLLVREDTTGELVGCYRMLPPAGAIAAGSLYTATEFDVQALDSLRPSLVEMGRAVVRADHRNGAVVLLMWAGILAYLDHCDYDYVTGAYRCRSRATGAPGSQVRGVRDFVSRRHAAPAEYTVYPYRPVVLDGRTLDEIAPPARPGIPPLMRGYLRLGAQVCGEPAHDPGLRRRGLPGPAGQAPGRHPLPDTAAVGVGRQASWSASMTRRAHPWLPRATCGADCVRAGSLPTGPAAVGGAAHHRAGCCWRCCCCRPCRCWRSRCRAGRICSAATAGWCCAAWACGSPCRAARFATCGACWWSAAMCPGWTSSRSGRCCRARSSPSAELISWPALGALARLMKVIPIDRASLRRLPVVVAQVADPAAGRAHRRRVPGGHHVVRPGARCVPAGDVPGRRRRRPAGSAAAADLPPPRRQLSTVPAYIGDDTLLTSIRRLIVARRTIAHVHVESLQLPGDNRRDLAVRCEAAVRVDRDATGPRARGHALAA